jgi:hypothetical protein
MELTVLHTEELDGWIAERHYLKSAPGEPERVRLGGKPTHEQWDFSYWVNNKPLCNPVAREGYRDKASGGYIC